MLSSFFFNDTATTEIYTPSLHDALPISSRRRDKSTRLNSSHSQISYAVFCLKKKDPKHKLQVPIKVVPAPFSAEPERIRSFDQEPHPGGAMKHSMHLAVYDVATHDGAPS